MPTLSPRHPRSVLPRLLTAAAAFDVDDDAKHALTAAVQTHRTYSSNRHMTQFSPSTKLSEFFDEVRRQLCWFHRDPTDWTKQLTADRAVTARPPPTYKQIIPPLHSPPPTQFPLLI